LFFLYSHKQIEAFIVDMVIVAILWLSFCDGAKLKV